MNNEVICENVREYLPLNAHTLLRILVDANDELENLRLNNEKLYYENSTLHDENSTLHDENKRLINELEKYRIAEYEENLKL